MEQTEKQRTYRMYGMVNYQLSGIQAGIQFGHAVQEYNNIMMDTVAKGLNPDEKAMKAFNKWRKEDKTFIILNGGTTNTRRFNGNFVGTLNQAKALLDEKNIQNAEFLEPDLGDQLTAFVFLVDDRVFDRVTWPDYSGLYYTDAKTPIEKEYYEWKMKFAETEEEADQIVFLRDWLPKFRLA